MTYRIRTNVSRLAPTLLIAAAPGCLTAAPDEGEEITNQHGEAFLSDHDSLYDGWPGNGKLADEGKADTTYPKAFTDLAELQSPVRSQGRRGVCSIFAAVGLMEHLYVAEGTIGHPDFSEEFLQWSVKVEVGAFRNSEGSNSRSNLKAISQYGIVTEADWPYLGRRWTTADDEACEGDNQPTRCYTHGDPPDEAMSARRWHLPAGRWISSRPNSIKAHMINNKESVVVGGTFFYQSWNHRLSKLPTNNEYWRQGYVTYPNDLDQEKSYEDRAGHAFVLVGWDDELSVQKRDGEGNMMVDENGAPIVETGFWLFKNSWGTGSFGVNNPHGDGYGWISMEYVEDFLTAYVAGLPELDVEEICGNGTDDDFDGDADCDDSDCQQDPLCNGGGSNTYVNDEAQDIPDNNASGIVSEIVVADGGTIDGMTVAVDITHSYRGDLRVKLVHAGGSEVVLHDREGSGQDDLKKTFVVADFDGEDASGTWRLVVSDHAGYDTGTLNRWSMEIVTGGGQATTTVYESDEDVTIPDNDPYGAFTNIEVADGGNISALKVSVTIDHSYAGDLTLKLIRVGLPGEVILQEASGDSGQFGSKSYVIGDHNGSDAQGLWRLHVIDSANLDEGTLQGWSLAITR